jgi:hypothetical protein
MNAYCVILRRQPSVSTTSYARSQRFYLTAPTADRAMRIAVDENPQFLAIGIEPGDLYSRDTPTRSEAA